MLAKRNGPTSTGDTFTDKWSGIDRRIKMRKVPSKPLDETIGGDSSDLEGKTAFRRNLLRGAKSNVSLV